MVKTYIFEIEIHLNYHNCPIPWGQKNNSEKKSWVCVKLLRMIMKNKFLKIFLPQILDNYNN